MEELVSHSESMYYCAVPVVARTVRWGYLVAEKRRIWRGKRKVRKSVIWFVSWTVVAAEAWHPRRIMPRTKECFSVSARLSMFHPYCAWGREVLELASLWSTNNRWLGSQQPLRHVTRFIAPSTLAKERLPCHTSACLCLKYPSFRRRNGGKACLVVGERQDEIIKKSISRGSELTCGC